ncbi:hypothetical protein [Priestia megaterium]|uniref:hypothetical protein n=1 Tax=Priestia megaterium TaxID=1404 RepID=UPI002E2520AA|nr:hypothetical protein [Priestia megaterium]
MEDTLETLVKEMKRTLKKVPLYGYFLKDYEVNGALYKAGEEFVLLREDKDLYVVEMLKQSLLVVSLPKELEEQVFVF